MTKRWIVPVDDEQSFEILETVDVFTGAHAIELRRSTFTAHVISPMVACQLGQALQDASREAGAREAKRINHSERNRVAHDDSTPEEGKPAIARRARKRVPGGE